ncbi:MAG: Nif3-like dinuclear metal center hexameric protein [Defluviitaleaceae bacterium]|nr:Nif3-like dinuclear metal center hexameric protein [Defluviitaleaceae bacterium]
MTTEKLMDLALEVAQLKEMPNDCGITVKGENIKKVLMGVDMDTPELMLAQQLGYDLVVTHHPRHTNVDMLDVLDEHILKLEALGVPRNKSQKLIKERKNELSYNQHVSNSRRSESAAQLLNMPFMSIHTPADVIGESIVQQFLDEKFKDKPGTTVQDIAEALEELGEYKNSARKPVIRVGDKESYAGKIYVLMSGLTGPGADVLKEYFEAGVGTLVMMHIPEADAKKLKEQNIGNVLIAGHMSSDSFGLNKIAEKWAEFGVETTMMSGVVKA